jgi:mannose-6-phosphate isomerase
MNISGKLKPITKLPLRINPTRVYRIYKGGRLIDEFRGNEPAEDGMYPEDWIASDTQALNPGREYLQEGLTNVEIPGGDVIQLKKLIEEFPNEMLGEKHVSRWGKSTSVLVKLLDSAVRLPVHCHPSRSFANRYMNSPYGKTEGWIIKQTRTINGVEPYLAMGFKPGITREDFAKWVKEQNGDLILSSLNRITVEAGDVYMVEAGLPHAIGEGILMIEVQEPSDWYVFADYASFGVSEEDAHQKRGWDLGLACFNYTNYSLKDIESTFKQQEPITRRVGNSYERRLISLKYAEFFRASELFVDGVLPMSGDGFYIGITNTGSGLITTANGVMAIQRGTTFIIPASVGEHEYISNPGSELEITICLPPII